MRKFKIKIRQPTEANSIALVLKKEIEFRKNQSKLREDQLKELERKLAKVKDAKATLLSADQHNIRFKLKTQSNKKVRVLGKHPNVINIVHTVKN